MRDHRAPSSSAPGRPACAPRRRWCAPGLRPVVMDEALRAGGQIYRQPPAGLRAPASARSTASNTARPTRLHRAMQALIAGMIDYRPGRPGVELRGRRAGRAARRRGTRPCRYTHLILATGATDRVLPFPGLDRCRASTRWAARRSRSKFQGCAIGPSAWPFMGTGPLLYLVAYQYAKAGAQVAAVLDTADGGRPRRRAGRGMLRRPGAAGEGASTTWAGCAHGVPLACRRAAGCAPAARARVSGPSSGATARPRAPRIDCDARGLRPEAARRERSWPALAGCDFGFDARDRNLAAAARRRGARLGQGRVPGRRRRGHRGGRRRRTRRRARRAGAAGRHRPAHDLARAAALESATGAHRPRARRAGTRVSFPEDWRAPLGDDDDVVCRCEEITAGTLRETGPAATACAS